MVAGTSTSSKEVDKMVTKQDIRLARINYLEMGNMAYNLNYKARYGCNSFEQEQEFSRTARKLKGEFRRLVKLYEAQTKPVVV